MTDYLIMETHCIILYLLKFINHCIFSNVLYDAHNIVLYIMTISTFQPKNAILKIF